MASAESKPAHLQLVGPSGATAGFDAYASGYQTSVERSVGFTKRPLEFFHQRKIDVLRRAAQRHLGALDQAAVLDVGCGSGITDTLLRPQVGSLTGVDVSAAMVEQAQRRNPDCAYSVYEGERLPFNPGTFDMVMTICVMHHVPPQQWRQFTDELMRVVRPGGVVVVIEHNRWNPATRRAVNSCEFDDDAVLVPERQLRRLLTAAGAATVGVRYFLFSTLQGPAGAAIDRRMAPVPLGGQYAAVAVRPAT
jgi:ubiquinone/menaquinone biosynthesis C-methylase UbiE